MQSFLATMLVIGGLAAVVATIPQALKVIRLKRSDELNLASWVIWLLYQVISVVYSYSIGAYLYVALNTLWGIFYGVMVVLIIKYRNNG